MVSRNSASFIVLLGVNLFSLFVSVLRCCTAPAIYKKNQHRLAGTSQSIPPDHLKQYSDLSVQWMQQYLRIDTTNPPRQRSSRATFFKNILDQEGIENRVFDYAPGRANLWARLPHTTRSPNRPIILLNHMDVVTSDPRTGVPAVQRPDCRRLHVRPRRAGHEG